MRRPSRQETGCSSSRPTARPRRGQRPRRRRRRCAAPRPSAGRRALRGGASGRWSRGSGRRPGSAPVTADAAPGPRERPRADPRGRASDPSTVAGATARAARPRCGPGRSAPPSRSSSLVLVMAMVLSFVVKTWLLQAFYIPSGSMEDTLLVSDRVIVSKLSPAPFDLHRGDVVVFEDPGGWLPRRPRSTSAPAHNGSTTRWSSSACCRTSPRTTSSSGSSACPATTSPAATPSTGSRSTGSPLDEPYIMPGRHPELDDFDITVPAGRIWVMGDHRSDTEDSRFHDPSGDGSDGSVPISDVTGRAVAVVWPLSHFGWLSDYSATFDRPRAGRRRPADVAPPGARDARTPVCRPPAADAPEPARRAGAPAGRAPGARGDGRGRPGRPRRSGQRRGRRHRRGLPQRAPGRPRLQAAPAAGPRGDGPEDPPLGPVPRGRARLRRRDRRGRDHRGPAARRDPGPGPARRRPDLVILDGNHDWLTAPDDVGLLAFATRRPATPPVTTMVKADLTCSSVAAASVLAKVTRDA